MQLMGEAEGGRLTQVLHRGCPTTTTVEQMVMLYSVGKGQARLDDFIDRYGHRAVAEMELAKPRWREDASYLHQIIDNQKSSDTSHSPAALHQAKTRNGASRRCMICRRS